MTKIRRRFARNPLPARSLAALAVLHRLYIADEYSYQQLAIPERARLHRATLPFCQYLPVLARAAVVHVKK